MKRALAAGLYVLGVLVLAALIYPGQVNVTWRLMPVQQSVIVPPALGGLTLSPGDKLVQRFTVPSDVPDFLSTAGTLALSFPSYSGKVAPDIRLNMYNPHGKTLGDWLLPSQAIATHAVDIPVVDPDPDHHGQYRLEMLVPLVTTTGAAPGDVTVAYAASGSPSGSSLTVSGRHNPGTVGLTVSYGVPLRTYLRHYPSMLLRNRTVGAGASLAIVHVFWLIALFALVVAGLKLVSLSFGARSDDPLTDQPSGSRGSGGRRRGGGGSGMKAKTLTNAPAARRRR